MTRQWRTRDRWMIQLDGMLRTLVPGALVPMRPSPALGAGEPTFSRLERHRIISLMRFNHSSGICTQGRYHGQGLVARAPRVSQRICDAADEQRDHLAWCEGRLKELGAHTSPFNPLYYTASFGLGVMLGRISDPVSLGFLHAGSELATTRLETQLRHLPGGDQRSRAILERMRDDSVHHAYGALEAGGRRLPGPLRWGLSMAAKALRSDRRLE
ncbi:ubiquinone biosynthesis monooxygenase Coq7 [Kushneria sinocarnis]|uniref:Ubiquinone biosynthesis monooxygenase Coq7 n=1 Tax=Kushneria sinocarnis TaxID=595502 RepID=A0A420WZA5_9GAMM|nr:2-polyprenyl-3-methyl-6-methoxy-1,4-benzoquinone monooxygenase [Kushneria sinocarnis]RKR06604.1 ubiquinone biosynthesis monooxygenase Coq7 [Kushneria sinocarnis]